MSIPRPTERNGPLSGHVRKGRRYSSPLVATGVLDVEDWTSAHLPDLIWPILVMGESGTNAARRFVQWQAAVLESFNGKLNPRALAACLDGRLSGLQRLAESVPDSADVLRNHARSFGLLSEGISQVITSFTDRPAAWFPQEQSEPPTPECVASLARAVIEVIRDGHREAVLKCLPLWAATQAGVLRTDQATIDLLRHYPTDPSTRARADSVIRAMWNTRRDITTADPPEAGPRPADWARSFWTQNYNRTACSRQGDASEPDDITEEPMPGDDDFADSDAETDLQQIALDLVSEYAELLETTHLATVDLVRQEVHAGLVTRAGREVIMALGHRDLWCVERGSHVTRVLIETRIHLEWMALQEASVYRTFKDYGAGKAKLYAGILREMPEVAGAAGGIEEFDRLSHNSGIIDHRVVDTRDSYSGKSLRAMAEEAGLMDLYRRSYYMASGVLHSEWWSLEAYCLEPCVNVLHGGHLIPNLTIAGGGDEVLAKAWIDHLRILLHHSLETLGVIDVVEGTSPGASDSDLVETGAAEPASN